MLQQAPHSAGYDCVLLLALHLALLVPRLVLVLVLACRTLPVHDDVSEG